MVVSIRQLRTSTKEVLSAVSRGEEVTVTNRGKACARISPVNKQKKSLKNDPVFGMWKNREDMKNPSEYAHNMRRQWKKHPAFGMLKDDPETADVPAYIRKIRKGRYAV